MYVTSYETAARAHGGADKTEYKVPKLKTNRGAAKRFARTATGKFKRSQSHLNHLLTSKSTKRKRHLRAGDLVSSADHAAIKKMLPYR